MESISQSRGAVQKPPQGFLWADLPPEDLPPIPVHDLIQAWQAATHAALAEPERETPSPLPPGVFFSRPDGNHTAIRFGDRDAACWAQAVHSLWGLDGMHGLAVCFRLLGLIDQLTAQEWLRDHFSVGGIEGPEIHPAILHTAAEISLNPDGRFSSDLFASHTKTRLGLAQKG